MSSQIKNRPNRKSHTVRVRGLSNQKRKKKHEEEVKFMLLSLQILALVSIFSVVGYGLDILIGWEHSYVAIAFMIISIGLSIWYAIKKFSKK